MTHKRLCPSNNDTDIFGDKDSVRFVIQVYTSWFLMAQVNPAVNVKEFFYLALYWPANRSDWLPSLVMQMAQFNQKYVASVINRSWSSLSIMVIYSSRIQYWLSPLFERMHAQTRTRENEPLLSPLFETMRG